ncbi:hypothetical protein ACJX0J_024791, partial [Zea mays]
GDFKEDDTRVENGNDEWDHLLARIHEQIHFPYKLHFSMFNRLKISNNVCRFIWLATS